MTPTPSRGPEPAPLRLESLACRRGERLLFQGLDLAVQPGQVVWLRGANGRGKTSLLRLITGLSSPDSGRVLWRGQAVRAAGEAFRSRLVYLGHTNGLKEDLTAIESLHFLARLHGRPADKPSLTAALARMGLASRREAPVRTLSQGQRRRVALARLALDLAADAAEPALWVLDEPYDALDADGIATLDSLLSAQAARGGAVVLTSHLPLGLTQPQPIELLLDGLAPPTRSARPSAAPA